MKKSLRIFIRVTFVILILKANTGYITLAEEAFPEPTSIKITK
ncbi:hypothetical protein [Mangrovibacillus cuniculi]|nr:hypothetical protein [Mangrovibacillus cuniculi]